MRLMQRPRRLRASESIREIACETRLHPSDLCLPFFVTEGKGIVNRNKHLPSALTVSVDQIKDYLKDTKSLGISMVCLFGVVSKKDVRGTGALDPNGPVIHAIKEIRSTFPHLIISTDIALDPYTDHGHDGLYKDGEILNDETIEVLCQMAQLHARAGAQNVSPSDMMDGRIGAIREALDSSGHEKVSIMAYTAKYASSLYGPFRDILNVNLIGDKKSYQMNPANRREAIRELELDLKEGADIVMVKPASWYLDVISDFKSRSQVPVAAYQVSGECALIELGAQNGLFDRSRAIMESLVAIKRSGADLILTYHALEAAELLG
jgi:porphobilinogen synthase